MTNGKNNKLENEVIAEAQLESEVLDMIQYAKTHEDLNAIGSKIKYAIDNGYKTINIFDLQVDASRKMREIYNKIGNYIGTD